MAETMHDRGAFWAPVPDWPDAEIRRESWTARRVSGFGQTLLSGDLDAAVAALSPGAREVGLWGLAGDHAHMVRIASDRALLVTPAPLALEPGWRDGFVATPCDDAYAVIELSGAGLEEIVAEATSADLRIGSRSAAVLFAGVTVFLYRTAQDSARIHVEAPVAAYLWTWLERRP